MSDERDRLAGTAKASRRISPDHRLVHLSEMPLGLVDETWDPGGEEFEKARALTALALTRLAKTDWPADQVLDWEVRSWLRQQHYGDPGMGGLRSAVMSEASNA